jgi:hypothetical protein
MGYRMLETCLGSPKGISVFLYEEGKEYDENSTPPLPNDLVDIFLREGKAEQVQPKPDEIQSEESQEEPPPPPTKKPKREYK